MAFSKTKQFTKRQLLSVHHFSKLEAKLRPNKSKEPFLCVITPIFDPALPSLKLLCKDLQNQTFGNFLHVVASNGPSVKVQDYINKLAKSDNRFVYVELELMPTPDFDSLMTNSGIRRDYCLRNFAAKRYLFLDADVEIIDNNYFSKLHMVDRLTKKDIIVTNVDYHGTILPIHPANKEGQIVIGNYCFSKNIAKKFRYPTNYNIIKKKQGNDFRYWQKIKKTNNVLYLDFVSTREGKNRSYKRMTDKNIEENIGEGLISVFGNEFSDYDMQGLKEVMDSHIVGYGQTVTQFETRFKNHIGFRHAVATNSCTNAFWVLLKALNLKKNDEVIVPSIYFFGIKNVLELHNIKYKVVDVDKGIPNISYSTLMKAVTKQTKAILFLEYGGYSLDIKKIKRQLKQQNRGDIILILDAANSPFTKQNDRYTALQYDYALYSFDMNKILVTGDGGMILSHHKSIIEKCRAYSYYGLLDQHKSGFAKSSDSGEWWCTGKVDPSLKLAMNGISASLGFSQLVQIDANLHRRQLVKELYLEKLKKLIVDGYIEVPKQDKNIANANYLFWIVVKNKGERNALAHFLREKKIYSTVKYEPLGTRKATPIAWDFFERSLCIPFNQGLSHVYNDYIVSQLVGFFYER
jgi:dTDP-4-amino-4,6-dideoxygalactose transaminase